MEINPATYGFISGPAYSGVHAMGSVWCGVLHDLFVLVSARMPLGLASDVAAGLSVYPCAQMRLEFGFDADWYDGTGGNNALWQDVHDGLKLQPCTPTMVDSRDAILLADEENYGGAHVCTMWCGFARRGLGVSAFSSGHQNRDVEEAFDFPPACGCGEIYRRADAAMKPENPAFTPKGR